MASYGVWWIELVVGLVVLLCLGLAAREAAAFMSVARMYLLLFPGACPRCLSRRGKQVTGWYRDRYGAPEFVDQEPRLRAAREPTIDGVAVVVTTR
jgi:hypothetical protein